MSNEQARRYAPAASLPKPKFGGDLSYGFNAVPLAEVLRFGADVRIAAAHTGATPDVIGGL